MKSFPEKVKECRGRLGLSQKELAAKANIGIRTITSYENGKRFPQSAQLYKLAEALEVSVDYLTKNHISDTSYNSEFMGYVEHLRQEEGAKAAFDLQEMLSRNQALFAGGSVSEEEKDRYFQALLMAYSDCKKAAKEQFSPKQARPKGSKTSKAPKEGM